MSEYIDLPQTGGGGSAYWGDAAVNFAGLPASGAIGEVRTTIDTGTAYVWDGAAWILLDAGLASAAASDTDSIDTTITSGVISAALRLSGDAASASFLKATSTIKSGGSPGLHVELPFATGSQTGVITSSDWTTFNAKEPAITAGTTSQYWRGDKSFQTLQLDALAAKTDGTTAATGKITEELFAEQATATSTGIGATGVWGSATSISLNAGNWMIWGVLSVAENGATLTNSLDAAITQSATAAGVGTHDMVRYPFQISGGADARLPIHQRTFALSGTTTIYLNSRFTYTAGAPQHYGKIWAVRIR